MYLSKSCLISALLLKITTLAQGIVSGWSAVGCYYDSTTSRTLRTASFTSVESMTIPSCISFCISGGFDFAGVEFGRECYCDTVTHSPSSLALNQSDCNVPCSGDATTICGGELRLNIFSTPPTPPTTTQPPASTATVDFLAASFTPNTTNFEFELQGCYVDPQNPRALLHQVSTSGLTTPLSCAAACVANGFDVMGLENGSECWCDDYMPYAVTANEQCTLPCNGDLTKACGGNEVIQVYGNTLNILALSSDQCLGGGRDSATYFPFGFQGVTDEGDTINLVAQQLNPGVTTDQQFILTSGDCFDPPCQGIPFFQLVNNQIIPYSVLGNPVALRAEVGESQFFTVFSSDTPFNGYCQGQLGMNNLPFVGFPTLDQTDGTTNQWGLCHNNSANGRLDAVYSPITNHPNYDINDCILVQLTLVVPGATAL